MCSINFVDSRVTGYCYADETRVWCKLNYKHGTCIFDEFVLFDIWNEQNIFITLDCQYLAWQHVERLVHFVYNLSDLKFGI